MEKPGLLDCLIAPLTWLERAKGWRRFWLLFLYAMTVLVVGVLGWRGFCLWGLPDIGDSFDVARYGTVEVRDADNAMVRYLEAATKLIPTLSRDYHVASTKAWDNLDWATADPEVRRWVVDNRPAFAIWLGGTERPDSLVVQPNAMNSESYGKPVVAIQQFAKLAMLEASALEAAGDLEGAWRLHRASLRASRHIGMHGGTKQRWFGSNIVRMVQPRILRWADDPQITPDLLRRAIAEVEACRRMTSPDSEMVRFDYFAVKSILSRPEEIRRLEASEWDERWVWATWYPIVQDARHFLMREPERSRRVLDLVIAGQLAQCDRPRADRPEVFKYSIYDVDAKTPPSVASVAPEELVEWADGSAVGLIWGLLAVGRSRIEAESGMFDTILIGLAERVFKIEHGSPPRTYGELLGPYLKALPAGIEPGDQFSATTSQN
jgi:hypothetical protein